jgi:hypothetical protein
MNTDTIPIEAAAAVAAAPKSSFFYIPGDPAIPTLVRVYGTIIRLLNAMMIVLALIGLVAAISESAQALAVMCVLQIALSMVLFAVGTGLRNGSKAAVYGVCALAAIDILGSLLLAAAAPQGGVAIVLATIFAVAIILLPPVLVAGRNWDKFH